MDFYLSTLLVVVFSSIAFLFSKSFLEDKQKEFEEEVLEFNLYEFSKSLNLLKNIINIMVLFFQKEFEEDFLV